MLKSFISGQQRGHIHIQHVTTTLERILSLSAQRHLQDAMKLVERGETNYALIPIENKTSGRVDEFDGLIAKDEASNCSRALSNGLNTNFRGQQREFTRQFRVYLFPSTRTCTMSVTTSSTRLGLKPALRGMILQVQPKESFQNSQGIKDAFMAANLANTSSQSLGRGISHWHSTRGSKSPKYAKAPKKITFSKGILNLDHSEPNITNKGQSSTGGVSTNFGTSTAMGTTSYIIRPSTNTHIYTANPQTHIPQFKDPYTIVTHKSGGHEHFFLCATDERNSNGGVKNSDVISRNTLRTEKAYN